MNLKKVFTCFPVLLCLTVCFFVVLPGNVLGGDSLAESTEDSKQLNSEAINTLLGEPSIPSFIAQPYLPLSFRPSAVPAVRPSRVTKHNTVEEETLLSGALPKLIEQKEPARPPKLLPEPLPEPGIVYVVPFTGVMVPKEVHERIFDQFVDVMNSQSASLGMQFVILKQGAKRVGPEWLAVRKYITGEIYAYLEESGPSFTEMRTKARITYHDPNQESPVFATVLPVSKFFDRNQTDINIERINLAESIATTLTERMLSVFDTSLISKNSSKTYNDGA